MIIFSRLSCNDYTQNNLVMIIMKYLSNKISSDLIIHKNQFNDYLVKIILKERWNDNNSAKNDLFE